MHSELEISALVGSCDYNETITISARSKGKLCIYKSRFLEFSAAKKCIIIDNPTPDTIDALPLSRGETIEVFFAFRELRYLFDSVIVEHIQYRFAGSVIFATAIAIPNVLKDGDKREYFRVPTGMRPPTIVRFNIFPKDTKSPIMSSLLENVPEDYNGEMVDISAGGFSMRTKPGDKPFPLERGDTINANFRLRPTMPNIEITSEVRNKRKYKGTEMVIWGLYFIEDSNVNRYLKLHRNYILRYVVERQREILAR